MPQLRDVLRISPARGSALDVDLLDRLLHFGLAAGVLEPVRDAMMEVQARLRRQRRPPKITLTPIPIGPFYPDPDALGREDIIRGASFHPVKFVSAAELQALYPKREYGEA